MSINALLIVKAIVLYNFLYEAFITVRDNYCEFYTYVYNNYKGHNNVWLFISGHTLPLSLNNLNNTVNPKWIYDNNNKSLIYSINRDVKLYKDTNIHHKKYKLAWLSAKLRIYVFTNHYIEYNIDDFIQKFVIQTHNIIPSLHVIFMCWCLYSKNWFKYNTMIEFHIIDDMGDEININLTDYNNSLVIINNKINISDDVKYRILDIGY